jgi:5-methyltetrahydrofolate--homocysteine methyltransferase
LLIIGERINSSIKQVENAIIDKDAGFIINEVSAQIQAGAQIIELNAGTLLKTEPEELVWLIQTANQVPEFTEDISIALDSSNPEAIRTGLVELDKIQRTGNSILNSVTAESNKLNMILPLVKKFNTKVIGLCMDEHGIPESAEERTKLGLKILKCAEEFQINKTDVYLDPLVLPVSTDVNNGMKSLETIKLLKNKDREITTVVGLSNISYGLPMRNLLNRTFLVMGMAAGLDAAIVNPLDKKLMSMVKTAEVLLAKDGFCMKYITAFRNGELE